MTHNITAMHHPYRQKERTRMSTTAGKHHHAADYGQLVSDAEECLGDMEELEWKLPIGAMIDYASENGLSAAVIERLERIQRAAAVLCNDGPEAIWGFANDAGMTDTLVAREQQRQAERRGIQDDPNSLVSKLRQKATW
jgi:hypothetical protein